VAALVRRPPSIAPIRCRATSNQSLVPCTQASRALTSAATVRADAPLPRLAFRPGLGKLAALNQTASPPSDRLRYALALGVGLVWAAAFPKLGVAGFAWLAPGLLLAVTLGRSGGAAFRIGYVAGLAFHLTALYWLLLIPVRVAPVLGWLALSAFQSLYPATWVWLCWKLCPVSFSGSETGVLALADRFLMAPQFQRMGWALACAALWVTWEMTQARLLSGFPWNFLGASQYQMLPVIQIASFTGVYGVSFLMAWFSVALIGAVAVMLRQATRPRSWMTELVVPMLCGAAAVSFGTHRLSQPRPAGPELKIALVQPSIPQTLIWNEKENASRFRKVIELSEQALAAVQPDLLVWPEAAVPSFARLDTNLYPVITNLVRTHRVWLVLGSDDAAPAARPRHADDYDFFNSSFLVSPDGEFVAGYRKRKLVIFGEYVPLARWLPFLKYFTPIQGGFTPGRQPVPFVLPDLNVKTLVLICFEDIFPHVVREYVEDDTDFLLNLTNNGWFGDSAAQWQHAASAVFRAVENGLPLVRCANNGLTCWVDAQGRLHEVYFPDTKNIYGAGCKTARVPTLAGQKREPTFYRRHGDWFGWGCVGLTALQWGWRLSRSKRRNGRRRKEDRSNGLVGTM